MNNKTTLERLTDARDYLADPDHFITGIRWSTDNIRNCALGAIERAYGFTTWPPEGTYPRFERFHASHTPEVGLLATAAKDLNLQEQFKSQFEHYEEFEDQPAIIVALVNNQLGHEPTLQMFNRAIELAATT